MSSVRIYLSYDLKASPTNHNFRYNLVTNENKHRTFREKGAFYFYSLSIKSLTILKDQKKLFY